MQAGDGSKGRRKRGPGVSIDRQLAAAANTKQKKISRRRGKERPPSRSSERRTCGNWFVVHWDVWMCSRPLCIGDRCCLLSNRRPLPFACDEHHRAWPTCAPYMYARVLLSQAGSRGGSGRAAGQTEGEEARGRLRRRLSHNAGAPAPCVQQPPRRPIDNDVHALHGGAAEQGDGQSAGRGD